MSTSSEAVVGGARWRLEVADDGRWEVAQRRAEHVVWDELLAGNGGLEGVRAAVVELRSFVQADGVLALGASAGLEVLSVLVDLAERAA